MKGKCCVRKLSWPGVGCHHDICFEIVKLKNATLLRRVYFMYFVQRTPSHRSVQQVLAIWTTMMSPKVFFYLYATALQWAMASSIHEVSISPQWRTTVGRTLWTSDQLVAETSTWQHTTLTTDRHPYRRRDSNPQLQQASGCRPTPKTARPLGQALKWWYRYANMRMTEHVASTLPLPINLILPNKGFSTSILALTFSDFCLYTMVSSYVDVPPPASYIFACSYMAAIPILSNGLPTVKDHLASMVAQLRVMNQQKFGHCNSAYKCSFLLRFQEIS